MIQFISSLALFILITIFGQKVIKNHLCPSYVVNYQVERSLSQLFSKNFSLELAKIKFQHLKNCQALIQTNGEHLSSNSKRKVEIFFEEKFEK